MEWETPSPICMLINPPDLLRHLPELVRVPVTALSPALPLAVTAEGHGQIRLEDARVPLGAGWDARVPVHSSPVVNQSAVYQAAFIHLTLYLTPFVTYALSILLFNYLIARPPGKHRHPYCQTQADEQGSRATISI